MKPYFIALLIPLLFTACKKEEQFTISRIQRSAKLATTETIIDKMIIGTKTKKKLGFINMGDATFAAHSKAIVKCGTDLSELTLDDVIIDGESIQVTLPHVRVLDFNYPFDQFEPVDELIDDGFANRMDILDYEAFYREAEEEIRRHLQYLGIKKDTENSTRRLMTALLKNMGYNNVVVTFKEGGEFIPQVNPNYHQDEGI